MKKISTLIAGLLVAILAVGLVRFPALAAVPGNNTLVTMKHDNSQARSSAVASALGGGASPSPLSGDGNFAIFFTNGTDDSLASPVATRQLIIRNLQTQTNELASISATGVEPNQEVDFAAVSETGRYVIFSTRATNLSSSVTTLWTEQTYIRDRVNNTVNVASITAGGTIANNATYPRAVSSDGRFVLFSSSSTSLGASQRQMFVKDMATGDLQIVSKSAGGTVGNSSSAGTGDMSCDGSFIAFTSDSSNLTAGDTNGVGDAFLVDLRNGFKISNLTQPASAAAYVSDISCNGRYITFYSPSQNLTSDSVTGTYYHSFMYDRISDSIIIADKKNSTGQVPPAGSYTPRVSDKGHVLFLARPGGAYVSSPSAGGKDHIYVRDTAANITYMLSVTSGGSAGNNNSSDPFGISSDGTKAIYQSSATNLSSITDTNTAPDYYLSDTGF